MKTALVTGSSGLVGSACVRHFDGLGWTVHGTDSGARRDFFGPEADVRAARERLCEDCPQFRPHRFDVRNRGAMAALVREVRPSLIIHAAAQPSHDWAAAHPFDDFEVNAAGTLNLLQAARRYAPEAPFVYLSTNKVYGDWPNVVKWYELESRYDHPLGSSAMLSRSKDGGSMIGASREWPGYREDLSIDRSTHSLFGCSKLAADLYVQEYGRYFGLPTCCLRAGCLTGSAHAGVEQHGFLAYLARCVREGRTYTIHGHKGKQVRDQLHAADVARACECFAANPRPGEVYNLGGGRDNSISVLEAIDALEQAIGRRLEWRYDETPRKGDHVVWISDTSKLRGHYPDWAVTVPLETIIDELARA